MTYQEAVSFVELHGEERAHDVKEKIEFLVFIAPTDAKLYEEFSRSFVLNHYNPNVILPYVNEDVCVMRVAKKFLNEGAFVYEVVMS